MLTLILHQVISEIFIEKASELKVVDGLDLLSYEAANIVDLIKI
jgi:hypothetical protein